MEEEDAVEPQTAEPIEQIMDQHEADTNVQEGDDQGEKAHEKTMVPLSALQKLREKKKELELELQWERQRNAQQAQASQKPPEEDNSRYESATREDLSRSQEEAVRIIEEKLWIKQNPEKFEKVQEYLPQFLKQRPNLASAINLASNRYEEAYELMDKLTPKQQQQLAKPQPPKKEAPNAPGGVPKAAALNETIDVMSMSDSEFAAWRSSQKKRR
jgi:hypothetical protein